MHSLRYTKFIKAGMSSRKKFLHIMNFCNNKSVAMYCTLKCAISDLMHTFFNNLIGQMSCDQQYIYTYNMVAVVTAIV